METLIGAALIAVGIVVAAVVYEESRFRADTRSPAGAVGLMQLLPDTARGIAQRTGGGGFRVRDLRDPDINVRYGCWYLRHLLDAWCRTERIRRSTGPAHESLRRRRAAARSRATRP